MPGFHSADLTEVRLKADDSVVESFSIICRSNEATGMYYLEAVRTSAPDCCVARMDAVYATKRAAEEAARRIAGRLQRGRRNPNPPEVSALSEAKSSNN